MELSSRKGFTLVGVIVATSIFVTVVMIAAGGKRVAVKTLTQEERKATLDQAAVRIFTRLEKDIKNAMDVKVLADNSLGLKFDRNEDGWLDEGDLCRIYHLQDRVLWQRERQLGSSLTDQDDWPWPAVMHSFSENNRLTPDEEKLMKDLSFQQLNPNQFKVTLELAVYDESGTIFDSDGDGETDDEIKKVSRTFYNRYD